MNKVKLDATRVEGYAVTAKFSDDLVTYTKDFLKVFNNVREYGELLGVRNYYSSNNVTVYCKARDKDAVVDFLKNFGDIVDCDKVLVYQVTEPAYDIDKYSDVFVSSKFCL